MAKASMGKWVEARGGLSVDLHPILEQLRLDYIAAAKEQVPTYQGGPSALILAELIRQGWRKTAG